MDFLRNHAHLAGGDTRKVPQNTQFSKSRYTSRGQGSPPRNHPQTYLSLTNPLNPSQPKYPMGMETHMVDALAKIKSTEPLRLAK
jgi:hypothetical protein